MATGQSILDRMELLDNELQLQTGEEDVTRGLVAVNAAQDYLESLLALKRQAFPSLPVNVTITSGVATSSFPSGFIRLDTIQLLNPTTLVPDWTLDALAAPPETASTFIDILVSPTGGRPTSYWTNGTTIYWDPIPSQNDTARAHGFSAASDITASSTIAYPDYSLLPLAVFAAQLMKVGVGDSTSDLSSLAKSVFGPVIEQMASFNTDSSPSLSYRYFHRT